MSAGIGRRCRPIPSRTASRLAAAVLALPLLAGVTPPVTAAIPAATASPGSVSDRAPVAGRAPISVGGLTYRDGAGTRNWGLRKHSAWSTRVIKQRYRVATVGGYRASSGDHGQHLAADFMVYSKAAKGYKAARFARKHRRQLNVTYVIWNQRIWSVERAREGWRLMADAGSPTANHKDHVHVSFRSSPNNVTYRR